MRATAPFQFCLPLLFPWLLVACWQAPAVTTPAQTCVAHLEFPSQDARRVWLELNVQAIAKNARARAFSLITESDGRGATLITERSCEGLDLDEIYGLRSGASATRLIMTDASESQQRLLQTFSSVTERTVHTCVMRFPADLEETGWLMSTLPFTGLGGAFVTGVDGEAFVTASAPCSALAQMTSAVLERPVHENPGFQQCTQSSLAACGFPDEITFGGHAP